MSGEHLPIKALFKAGQTVLSKKDLSKSPLLIIKVSPIYHMVGSKAGAISKFKYLVENVDKTRCVFHNYPNYCDIITFFYMMQLLYF